jgi:recombination protein RecT
MENKVLKFTKYQEIKAYATSDEVKERFIQILGDSRAGFSYIASVLTAVAASEDLQQCTPISIMSSAVRAATLRLSCDPATKQAYLVPFKNKKGEQLCTFIAGYKGIQDMALRTMKYRYLNVFPIYNGMTVEEDLIKGIHTLSGGKVSDDILGFMLSFELLSGFAKTFYMTWDEILAHAQKYSKSFNYKDGPWQKETFKMARKTVLRVGLMTWGYFEPTDVHFLNFEDDSIIENVDPIDLADLPDPKPIIDKKLAQVEEEDTHSPYNQDELTGQLGF